MLNMLVLIAMNICVAMFIRWSIIIRIQINYERRFYMMIPNGSEIIYCRIYTVFKCLYY